MKPTFRVFISAATSEFEKARSSVASDLRARGLEVKVQDDFRQEAEADTTLRKLHDYIKDCSAVICIIGSRSGAVPPAPTVQPYADLLPAGLAQASYTQWELIFARHYKKRVSLYLANAQYAPDRVQPTGEDIPELQQAFIAYLKGQGLDRSAFSTTDQLCRLILKEEWPQFRTAKPIALPYPSLGSLFKGRIEFLDKLRRSLVQARTGHATAIVGKALHGLGGVGKTRLAVEYAWRHAEDYTALLFVSADTPENLRRNLAALAGPMVLDLPEQDAPEEEVRYAATLNWLQGNPGWLLILDNVDSPKAAAAAEQLLAQLHGGHVLLTSRLSNWSGSIEPLELDVLTVEDARAFLLERTAARRRKAADDDAQVRTLAEELGRLALALEQAGAYIAQHRLTFAQYLEEWCSRRDKVLQWFDERLMHYPKSVAVTWQTSFDQLSEPTRRLLHRLAWFAPEPIPESLLDVPIPDAAETDVDLLDALVELETYLLVTRAADTPRFSVHRLVQDVTRRSLRDDTGHEALNEALRWINDAFVGDPFDVRSWPTLDPLAPHALTAARHADQAGIADPTALLMNQLGVLLNTKALHKEAELLMRRALAIDEQCFGLDHPNVARDVNNLAVLLQYTNRLAEAEPLMRRALGIDEQSFGPDHPDVARGLNNLALLLYATNRLSEAEPLMRRALAIVEQSFGPDHPNVATALNNLAQLLKATNRLIEAEPLMSRSLAIVEQSFGPDHPNVAPALNNLARLFQATNRLAQAEPLMRRSLTIDEQSLGPDHPDVARDLNNLAQLLKTTNRLSEAELLSQRSLKILLDFTRRTVHEHPYLRGVLTNYTVILEDLGRSEEDRQAAIQALFVEYGVELK